MRVNIPRMDVAKIGGGFADVFRCMDRGLMLAVKVLRTRSNVSLEKMTRVGNFRGYITLYALALTSRSASIGKLLCGNFSVTPIYYRCSECRKPDHNPSLRWSLSG